MILCYVAKALENIIFYAPVARQKCFIYWVQSNLNLCKLRIVRILNLNIMSILSPFGVETKAEMVNLGVNKGTVYYAGT